jgi:hypothetical protein
LRLVLTDKAYDAAHLCKLLEAQGTEVVSSSTRARRRPQPLNRCAYRGHNVIKRMFGRRPSRCRIATRYDRLAGNFLPTVALVAAAGLCLT